MANTVFDLPKEIPPAIKAAEKVWGDDPNRYMSEQVRAVRAESKKAFDYAVGFGEWHIRQAMKLMEKPTPETFVQAQSQYVHAVGMFNRAQELISEVKLDEREKNRFVWNHAELLFQIGQYQVASEFFQGLDVEWADIKDKNFKMDCQWRFQLANYMALNTGAIGTTEVRGFEKTSQDIESAKSSSPACAQALKNYELFKKQRYAEIKPGELFYHKASEAIEKLKESQGDGKAEAKAASPAEANDVSGAKQSFSDAQRNAFRAYDQIVKSKKEEDLTPEDLKTVYLILDECIQACHSLDDLDRLHRDVNPRHGIVGILPPTYMYVQFLLGVRWLSELQQPTAPGSNLAFVLQEVLNHFHFIYDFDRNEFTPAAARYLSVEDQLKVITHLSEISALVESDPKLKDVIPAHHPLVKISAADRVKISEAVAACKEAEELQAQNIDAFREYDKALSLGQDTLAGKYVLGRLQRLTEGELKANHEKESNIRHKSHRAYAKANLFLGYHRAQAAERMRTAKPDEAMAEDQRAYEALKLAADMQHAADLKWPLKWHAHYYQAVVAMRLGMYTDASGAYGEANQNASDKFADEKQTIPWMKGLKISEADLWQSRYMSQQWQNYLDEEEEKREQETEEAVPEGVNKKLIDDNFILFKNGETSYKGRYSQEGYVKGILEQSLMAYRQIKIGEPYYPQARVRIRMIEKELEGLTLIEKKEYKKAQEAYDAAHNVAFGAPHTPLYIDGRNTKMASFLGAELERASEALGILRQDRAGKTDLENVKNISALPNWKNTPFYKIAQQKIEEYEARKGERIVSNIKQASGEKTKYSGDREKTR